MLASLLVDFPGSSAYLRHSIVSYANAAKRDLLQVPPATLEQHGAVSLDTALAMAVATRALGDSDYALAITGVAGPEGGSEAKPVGTVAIALCDRRSRCAQLVRLANRSRNLVRTMSCAVALDMLRRRLLGLEPIVAYPFIPATAVFREDAH